MEATLNVFVVDLPTGIAHVALAVILLDERTDLARLLLQQTFSATAKLASKNVPDLVEALSAALRDVLAQAERRVGVSQAE